MSEKNNNWLEDANELDVYVGTRNQQINELTDRLLHDFTGRVKVRKKSRTREALKQILLNLWIAHKEDKPLKYSRSPNSYSRSHRYGKLHFRYHRVIPIIDTLEKWGLVHQENGFYDHEKKLGRQTRCYASNDLIGLFHNVPDDFNMIDRIPPRESIQLKDDEKQEVDYEESDETVAMRINLSRYNEFIRKQRVKLALNRDTPCTMNLVDSMKSRLLHGYTSIASINSSDVSGSSSNLVYSKVLSMTNKVRDIVKGSGELGLKDKTSLEHYDIDNITILLKYEILKRVFNKESFDLGGRFYGAAHIFLNEDDRALLTINDNPTVELDYSGHHIRMLYHILGMEYVDDPYETLGKDKAERKPYKLVSLVSINCPPEKSIIWSIRSAFNKAGFSNLTSDKTINQMIERFREAHEPIADFLFSGVGLKLQNRDSKITEDILMRLMKDGIPCLPIHDSYIVEAQYRDILEQTMIEVYEKRMGFKPVID
jgi:hypothetical protein